MRVSKCRPLTRPQKEVCSQYQTELLARTTRSQGSLSPLQHTLVRALGINIYHKACNFMPAAHLIWPQSTKKFMCSMPAFKTHHRAGKPILTFLLLLNILRASLMETSQRQRAQGHSANPGRSRMRTHLSGQVPFLFLRLWSQVMYNSGYLQQVLRFLLFKMENQVVLIPGEFYIFATFFFLHLVLERERQRICSPFPCLVFSPQPLARFVLLRMWACFANTHTFRPQLLRLH